jgi:hypothetical protein
MLETACDGGARACYFTNVGCIEDLLASVAKIPYYNFSSGCFGISTEAYMNITTISSEKFIDTLAAREKINNTWNCDFYQDDAIEVEDIEDEFAGDAQGLVKTIEAGHKIAPYDIVFVDRFTLEHGLESNTSELTMEETYIKLKYMAQKLNLHLVLVSEIDLSKLVLVESLKKMADNTIRVFVPSQELVEVGRSRMRLSYIECLVSKTGGEEVAIRLQHRDDRGIAELS